MFELANPWVLLGLPLPIIVWFVLPYALLQHQAALNIPFFKGLENVITQHKVSFGSYTQVMFLGLIWVLTLFALAGPRWVGEPQPLAREGHNIMLALDISGSMELTDITIHGRPVSRLDTVKQAAERFVQQRLGDKIGLILFGSNAYLQTPLTYDHQNVLMRLEDATVGLAGQTTSIGDAVGLAVKRLQTVAPKGRVIILLTDGANNSGVLAPMKAAELAKEDHIKIYTIGLGPTADNNINNLFFNMNAAADLDEKTLKKMAKLTGGRYFRATDLQSLQTIYKTISQLETTDLSPERVRPQHEYYPWVLAVAFLLLGGWLAQLGGLRLKRRERTI